MKAKITEYINAVFAPFEANKNITELKSELLLDLHERFNELIASGKDEETAYKITIESIGDIEEIIVDIKNSSENVNRKIITDFSARVLSQVDLSCVTAHESDFSCSILKKSDLQNSDFTGSKFFASDLQGTNCTNTNLTECTIKSANFNGAIFDKTNMSSTNFITTGLDNAEFSNIDFQNTKFSMCELRKTVFKSCRFDGTEFAMCDLRNNCFDGISLSNVTFKKCALAGMTFKGATIRNVLFVSGLMITNKFYRDLQQVNFEGAFIDKLTYASLKGIGACLDGAIVV